MTAEEKLGTITALISNPFGDCPGLTDREREVLNLASYGIPAIRIAKSLGFSRAYFYKVIAQSIPKLRHYYDRPNLCLGDLTSFMLERIKEVLK